MYCTIIITGLSLSKFQVPYHQSLWQTHSKMYCSWLQISLLYWTTLWLRITTNIEILKLAFTNIHLCGTIFFGPVVAKTHKRVAFLTSCVLAGPAEIWILEGTVGSCCILYWFARVYLLHFLTKWSLLTACKALIRTRFKMNCSVRGAQFCDKQNI